MNRLLLNTASCPKSSDDLHNGDGTTTRSGLTARSEVKPQTNSLRDSLHEWTNFGGRSLVHEGLGQIRHVLFFTP